jgi:RNA polymerase primary sigma factor
MARMRNFKISNRVTPKSPTLDKYLSDISKKSLITAEEEVRLVRLVKQGDTAALKELVEANLRFVVSVAKQYQYNGLELPDLINEGNIGLIKATGRFDETRGFKFLSYAVWWVRQQILEGIAKNARIVSLPEDSAQDKKTIEKRSDSFEQENGRAPNLDEIVELTGMTRRRISVSLSNKSHISMDAPFPARENANGETTMLDMMQSSHLSDEETHMRDLRKEVERILTIVTNQEMTILTLSYGLNGMEEYNNQEIGEKLGISGEAVRQIKNRAIRRIRKAGFTTALMGYLS